MTLQPLDIPGFEAFEATDPFGLGSGNVTPPQPQVSAPAPAIMPQQPPAPAFGGLAAQAGMSPEQYFAQEQAGLGNQGLQGQALQQEMGGNANPVGPFANPLTPSGSLAGSLGVLSLPGQAAESVAEAAGAPEWLQKPIGAVANFLPFTGASSAAKIGTAIGGGLGSLYGSELGEKLGVPDIPYVGNPGGLVGGLLGGLAGQPATEEAVAHITGPEGLIRGEGGFGKLPWGGPPEKPWGTPRELGTPKELPPGEHPPAFDENGNPLPGFDASGRPALTAGDMQGQTVSGPAALGESAGGPWSIVRSLITKAEPLPAENEALRSQLRSQRVAAAERFRENNPATAENLQKYRNMLFQTGEMPRTSYPNVEPQLAPGVADRLRSDIYHSPELQPYERARVVDAFDKLMSGDLTRMQENELRLLDKVANPEIKPGEPTLGDEIRKRIAIDSGVKPEIADYLGSLYRTPARFLTYMHGIFLKPGVGIRLNPMNFHETKTAVGDWFRALRSPEGAQFVRDRNAQLPFIGAEDPEFASYQPRNMGLRPEWHHLNTTVIDRAVDKIPGMVASGRAVGTELSSLRDLVYNKEAFRLYQSGERDPASFKALYEALSHETGFGNPGAGPTVTPLFSLQHFLGRWKALIDPFNKPGSFNPLGVGARPAAIRNLLTIFGISAGTTELAKALGIPTDIGSVKSPLGTIKLGYTQIQPSAGYNSMLKLTEKMGRAIAGGIGEQVGVNLGPTIGYDGLKNIAADYMRGQLGPVSDLGLNLFTGQDWKGAPYNLLDQAKKNGLADLWAPIAAREIWDAVKENGPIGALYSSPALGAETVSTNVPVADQRTKAMADLGLQGDYSALSKEDKKKVNDSIGYEPSQRATLTLTDVGKADEALQRYHAYQSPDNWIQFKNYRRALNENDASVKAWNDSKDLISYYEGQSKDPKNLDKAAQNMYGKTFSALTGGQQNEVKATIHNDIRTQRPDVDAYLLYWGAAYPNREARSQQGLDLYKGLLQKYGSKSVYPPLPAKKP